ncbi:MAG: amidohydrolase family protein, partial [Chloroflexi bacterium]|nr:amidohydrolase family protein [Chloroflexota bacterium]
PKEYWDRQCYVEAMFRSPDEAAIRYKTGVHKIMWGSDYPHFEGSWPHSKRTLHGGLAGLPKAEIAAMLGENAAKVYGFDLKQLRPVADRVGPTVAEI